MHRFCNSARFGRVILALAFWATLGLTARSAALDEQTLRQETDSQKARIAGMISELDRTIRASRAELAQLLAQAAAGIVVCGDLRKAHANEESYLLQDCSAAIENLLLAAAALGLGACWLGVHPRPDRQAHVRLTVKLPAEVVPVSIIALGWPAEAAEPRTRYAASAVHQETW